MVVVGHKSKISNDFLWRAERKNCLEHFLGGKNVNEKAVEGVFGLDVTAN